MTEERETRREKGTSGGWREQGTEVTRIINLRCYTVVTGEPDVVTSEVSRPACHSPLVTRTPTLSHSSHLIPVRTTRAPPGTSGGSDGR